MASARPLTTAGYAVPAPPRPLPVPTTKRRARSNVQGRQIAFLVMLAMLVLSAGVVYLSGYARMTAEGYRRVKVMHELRQEQVKAQQLRELRGTRATSETIDKWALHHNMVRPGEKETVTVR